MLGQTIGSKHELHVCNSSAAHGEIVYFLISLFASIINTRWIISRRESEFLKNDVLEIDKIF